MTRHHKTHIFFRLIFLADGYMATWDGLRFAQHGTPFDFESPQKAIELARLFIDPMRLEHTARKRRRLLVRIFEDTHGHLDIGDHLLIQIPDDDPTPIDTFAELITAPEV